MLPELSRRRMLFGALALAAGPGTARAQFAADTTPILTIESERFFADSAFGQRLADEIEAEGVALAAENRRIEAELTAEEKDLTEKRDTLDADTFRALANAFDTKVQDIRRTQDIKARALNDRRDAGRVAFLRAAGPVLEKILSEYGAGVILERNSVFFSSNSSDITDLAVARIDEAIGDGATLQP